MNSVTRRGLFKAASGAAAIGVVSNACGSGQSPPSGSPAQLDDKSVEKLAGRIMETDPKRIVDLVCDQLENGLSEKDLLATCFNAGARFHGHHSGFVAHPIEVVSNSMKRGSSLLPLFYYLSVLRFRAGRSRIQRIDNSKIPTAANAESFFHEAMKEGDRATAERSMISLCRSVGAEKAYQQLWTYGAERNGRTGGHAAISIANSFRTLAATNWRCSETAIQFAMSNTINPSISTDAKSRNRERMRDVDKLPRDWSSVESDHGATLELMNTFRSGNSSRACKETFQLLRAGKVNAASVWDAVFLTTAELIIRYKWVGQKMLAGHSVTCVNALHFMFRSLKERGSKLYALLEAVEWTTSFLAREKARPALRDFDILSIEPADVSKGLDAVSEIFDLLPPRRFASMSRIGFDDVDKAMGISLAWAQRQEDYEVFLQKAMFLMCIKSTPEVHDFKFPMALFENLGYCSKRYRPFLLAASVHVLHGTKMEDSAIVAQARERLGK